MADKGNTTSTHTVANQDEVAAFLQDPATHGGLSVERFDTHGAMVFLAGTRAYKVKRAVKFSYMDFSTLAKRQEACEREIALNRRTAPKLYLNTLAITRGRDGGLALGGTGDIVEWAVVMRRFEQSDLLDRIAQEGRLTGSLLGEVAEAIARFHDAAEPLSAETETGGGSEGLRWAMEDSLDELAERPELFPPNEVETLAEATRARLAATAALLDRRLAQGYVRRCHGDLHLRNICLVDGVPTLFDCIEFNDRIACIDVFYDLAFLLMDLDYLGLRPQANLVFNRYLQATGDLTGPGTLALFLASRAMVRAKVGASVAANQADAGAQAAWREEAGRYFRDALAYLTPAAPRLVAVGGLSGTGKTTVARALAPGLGAAPGAVHLRSDVIRKERWGVGEQDRLPEKAYQPEVTEDVYHAILERAGTVLAGGQSVVADAVYARPQERAAIEALAREHSLAFHGLWLSTEADTLVTRVEDRTDDASDATAAVVRRQLDYEIGPIAWQRVNAGGSESEVLEAARAALEL
jgi:aminoglycoside phosphotransferase family enzyme/predicted kinase